MASMAGRAARQADTVVEDERERDFTAYANKEPTGTMEAFADWLIEEVGLEFANQKLEASFRDGVRLGGTLRMEFQASDYWREDERNPRSEAGRKARAAANGAAKEAKSAKRSKAVSEDETDEAVEAKPARRGRAAGSAAPAKRAGRSRAAKAESASEDSEAPY